MWLCGGPIASYTVWHITVRLNVHGSSGMFRYVVVAICFNVIAEKPALLKRHMVKKEEKRKELSRVRTVD